jgi:hypothetical protein
LRSSSFQKAAWYPWSSLRQRARAAPRLLFPWKKLLEISQP